MNERTIFIAAIDVQDPAARARYLDEACGLDAAMRGRIEALLRNHAKDDGFLQTPAFEEVTLDGYAEPLAEGPGTAIGRYKLLEKIGEGGMGVVYMAEPQPSGPGEGGGRSQAAAPLPKVALKIIKPGMDSRLVVARFDAERHALSLMDHPNIARVLDAGTTDTGRPYFVMELVHGKPLTAYCDAHRLGLRQRLELFAQVCHAVQHAHTKGIIHRDLKPSNVLVTMYDGRAVPKVIDFGVAKATEQRLTERTLFTHYGALVGTVGYMAPEQAEMSALGVDTRSDVYSLGVLLYELLTGTTPLGDGQARQAALLELLRQVRESEPAAPSTRLSTSDDAALGEIAARRGTDPQKLTKLVRGELDWIVMKCLEKDRARRYETAHGLARDVERYLADEPVTAAAPGARYRVLKFARRNKVLLATTSAVAAALVLGSGLATYGLVNARRDRTAARAAEAHERRSAVEAKDLAERRCASADANAAAARREARKAAEISNFLRDMLAQGDAVNANGRDATIREALDVAVRRLDQGRLAGQPDVEGALRHTIGTTYRFLGMVAPAKAQLRAALDLRVAARGADHPDVALTLFWIGQIAHEKAERADAAAYLRRALEIQRKAYPDEHEMVVRTMLSLADALDGGGDSAEGQALRRRVAEVRAGAGGERRRDLAVVLHDEGMELSQRGDFAAAEAKYRQAMEIYRQALGDRHPNVASLVHNLGVLRFRQGDEAGAEPFLRDALSRRREALGPRHPTTTSSLRALHLILARRNDPEAARLQMEIHEAEVARLTGELKVLPEATHLLARRAVRSGRLGRFEDSTADWELTAKLNPRDWHAHYAAAVGRVYQGDLQAGRAHARAMLQRFSTVGDASVPEHVARTCALAPPGEGWSEELGTATPLIDHALLAERHEHTLPWLQMTKAMVEYPSGNMQSCLDWTVKSRANNPNVMFGDRRYPLGTALALAAMAHHHLGHVREARQALAEATALMDGAPKPGERDLGTGELIWQIWAIHLREARQLINGGGHPAAAPPALAAAPPAETQPGDPDAARVQAFRMESLQGDAERLGQEMEARPADVDLANARADVFCRLGRFAEATAGRINVTALRPDDVHAHFCAAVGELYAGEVDAYRARAKAMVDRAAASEVPGAELERTATAYLLSPPPGGDVAAAGALIDRDLQGFRANGWHGWAELTKAMAEYRAGRFDECLLWLEKFRAVAPQIVFGDRRYLQGTGLTLAAMAHHQLGQDDEAARYFEEAQRLMDQCPQPGKADLGTPAERWQVWQIFMREARELLDRESAPTAADATAAGG